MKLVKCKLCEKYFDREKEPFVRIGARYAHKTCQEKKEEDIKNANLVEQTGAFRSALIQSPHPYLLPLFLLK